jgi:uncharacterized protein YdhG (YjbR/CyaY superfamily)
MQSQAKTFDEYIQELPEDRREAISTLRALIKKNLPEGYEEGMGYGMPGYSVPLSRYPKGYLGRPDEPLPYIGLASQKNYMSLYLMNIYANKDHEKWFREAFKKAGKKLDMGKSCVRFKKLDDLPLDVIAKAVALTPVDKMIDYYESAPRRSHG